MTEVFLDQAELTTDRDFEQAGVTALPRSY
jgi:hypothetical protein